MSALPKRANLNRKVIDATAITESDGWWTGIVRDRVHETGETRLRLERHKNNGGRVDTPHTWRLRPEYWADERDAVDRFEKVGGSSPPAGLPVSDYLEVTEYEEIRSEDGKSIAVVEVEKPTRGRSTRLYHFTSDGTVRQKWTVSKKDWDRVKRRATNSL